MSELDDLDDTVDVRDRVPLCGLRKPRCKRGHPLTPENVYVWRGVRQCRACIKLRAAVKKEAAARGMSQGGHR